MAVRAVALPPRTATQAGDSRASPIKAHHAGRLRRRDALIIGAQSLGVSLLLPSIADAAPPDAVSRTWSAVTGAQSDLFFPDSFLGEWTVAAVLKSVETPMGMEYVQDARVVDSARAGLGGQVQYPQRFVRNSAGRVVPDRAFNTVRLVEAMSETGAVDTSEWSVDDPNVLRLKLRGGRGVFIRVTARRQEEPETSRIVTSEVVEQVLDSLDGATGAPRLRRSRCVTKYKYRSKEDAAASGGPQIIANQIVYDYADLMGDVETQVEAAGKPVVVYTYSLAFYPPQA